MRDAISTAVLSALLLLAAHLTSRATSLPAHDPERTVLTTVVYTISSAAAVHLFCDILHDRPENDAQLQRPPCLSYALGAATVASQAHIYATGGYTDAEWEVVGDWLGDVQRVAREWRGKAKGVFYTDRLPLSAKIMEDDDDR